MLFILSFFKSSHITEALTKVHNRVFFYVILHGVISHGCTVKVDVG